MQNWTIVIVVACVAALLLLGLEVGFRLGLRARRRGNPMPQLGPIQGAALGLLGLLLGFSFSGAATRFIERQDIIVREANAIGTAYLRADLLGEPHRTRLREELRGYAIDRLELFKTVDPVAEAELQDRLGARHQRIWTAGLDGVRADPAMTIVVVPPLNETFDLLGVRNASTQRHLPRAVLALLVACSMLSVGLIAYGCGRDGKRQLVGSGSLVLLIAAALWLTIDLDYPRLGSITMRDDALEAVIEMMDPPSVSDKQ
jgi:hypothetical protein